MKKALITGITGQDGSHLADFLLERDYAVVGVVRRSSSPNYWRIQHLLGNPALHLVQADLMDQSSLVELMRSEQPDEVYNLAAQSFVGESWNQPILTAEATGVGVLRVLEAVRTACPTARFYQASSSEMFGKVRETPQTELTPFYPRSPYGVAKTFGHYTTVNYRESYGLFACSGILFNHEGPRRGEEFVTRKITKAAARISLGLQTSLHLGNLDARRDWGSAEDYVEAMWLMLQQDQPDDFVIATGSTHDIRYFLDAAFSGVGYGYRDWEQFVVLDPSFVRPAEVDLLVGDASKAKRILGWESKTNLIRLVDKMLDADLARERKAA